MRRSCASLLLVGLAVTSCGGDPAEVLVELELAEQMCGLAEQCGHVAFSRGLVFETNDDISDEPRTMLYADFLTPEGDLALLEIELGTDGRDARIRYREVFDDGVRFLGDILEQHVDLERISPDGPLVTGNFAFVAVDPRTDELRVVRSGRVSPDQEAATPGATAPSRSPRPSPSPRPRSPDVVVVDDGSDVVVDTTVVVVDEGCDGSSDPVTDDGCGSSDTSGGGCEGESSSSGGCEGDTVDGGGCDGADSSGGCDGDSGGGCDGDAGDGCSIRAPAHGRAARSMFRLLWPMFLAGGFNRWMSRRRRRSR